MDQWGVHKSPWYGKLKKPHFDSLRQDLKVDVVVVGAGITGLMTATHLQGAGLKVAVIDAGEVGSGATGVSTGHLTQVPDCSFKQLVSNFGEDLAYQFVQSSQDAIDVLEGFSDELLGNFGRDCEYSRIPGFKYTENLTEVSSINDEVSCAKTLGLKIKENSGCLPFSTSAIFEVQDQAMFNPLNFVMGLAERFVAKSGLLFENSRVAKIDDDRIGKVHTALGSVQAKSIVLATHTPIGIYLSLHTRLVPLVSYVMGVKLKNPPSTGLYWDTSEPYYYLRPWKEDIWIIGGRDHKTGQEASTLERYVQLNDYIHKHFEVAETSFYWSGELFESLDYVPYIGKIPFTTSLYSGTGYAGAGLTLGTVASKVISDTILGRKTEYTSLYDPLRFKPMASGHSFIAQNANVAKWMITDQLTHHHTSEIKQIAPNEGKVIDVGGKKLAIFRNENGRIHVLSSKCTHMGATVHWNTAEKTWDCPCHGGRYKANGEICEGPQLKDLEDVPLHTEENPDVAETFENSPSPSGLSPVPDQLGVTTF
jgi:glycine/D-amino acid oxidase-like deaminating enzyme/nitrite reductase/ring-hydroxylating ferredoxin subunit